MDLIENTLFRLKFFISLFDDGKLDVKDKQLLM